MQYANHLKQSPKIQVQALFKNYVGKHTLFVVVHLLLYFFVESAFAET